MRVLCIITYLLSIASVQAQNNDSFPPLDAIIARLPQGEVTVKIWEYVMKEEYQTILNKIEECRQQHGDWFDQYFIDGVEKGHFSFHKKLGITEKEHQKYFGKNLDKKYHYASKKKSICIEEKNDGTFHITTDDADLVMMDSLVIDVSSKKVVTKYGALLGPKPSRSLRQVENILAHQGYGFYVEETSTQEENHRWNSYRFSIGLLETTDDLYIQFLHAGFRGNRQLDNIKFDIKMTIE